MDGEAGVPTPGRPLWVLRELVRNCQADVFDHAESPFKRLLHGVGREVSRLERAGPPCRFPCSRGCCRSRNVFSGATSVGFTFAWRASCAFHARLPCFGNDRNVRRLVACPMGMVGSLLAAWPRASSLLAPSPGLPPCRRRRANKILRD